MRLNGGFLLMMRARTAPPMAVREAATDACKSPQLVLDAPVDAAGGIEPILVPLAGRLAGQQRDAFFDRRHRIDGEPP